MKRGSLSPGSSPPAESGGRAVGGVLSDVLGNDSNRAIDDPAFLTSPGRQYTLKRGVEPFQLESGHEDGVQPLSNLLLTMLNRAGVPVESMGDSTGQCSEV